MDNYVRETSSNCRNGKAVVHFWEYRSMNEVGHISLTLSNETHISYWPTERGKNCLRNQYWKQSTVNPNLDQTMEKDIEFEGRLPDKKCLIPSARFDENRIVRWWRSYLDSRKYDLIGNNCAVAVCRALHAGGFGFDYRKKSISQMAFGRAMCIEEICQPNFIEGGTLIKPSDAFNWIQDALTEWPDATAMDKLRYFITDPFHLFS